MKRLITVTVLLVGSGVGMLWSGGNGNAGDHIIVELLFLHQAEQRALQRQSHVDDAMAEMWRRVADAEVAMDEAIREWVAMHTLPECDAEFRRGGGYVALHRENTELWELDTQVFRAVRGAEAICREYPPATDEHADVLVAICDVVGVMADELRDRAVTFAEIIRSVAERLRAGRDVEIAGSTIQIKRKPARNVVKVQ